MATWASRQIVICIAVALVGLSAMRSARAEESAGPATVDFARDVAPIFTAHCLECHGADLQESDFRLDRGDSALRGGANGAAIVPGKSGESSLVERVVSLDPDRRMPPEGDRLSAERVTTLRKWIDQGANWPKDSGPASDAKSQHWSLLPLVKPQVPKTAAADATVAKLNPIDAFVLAKLAEHKLRNSPEADRRTLIRRVTIDLTGLQPTPEDVAAFLADTSAEAYERVVDRLLASPRYGERWARHWMDVAHFAETHGNDQDRPRPNAWPYRDYLIRAFNDDKPYAQFVSEQVAGDVLYRDDPQATVALGFLAAGSWDESSLMCIVDDTIDKKLAQVLDRDDMITNCMSTFTSTTVHCARCHNHKFDPIPQAEYYGLQAVFAGVDRADRTYDPDPAVHLARRTLHQRRREILARDDASLLSDAALQSTCATLEAQFRQSREGWTIVTPLTIASAGNTETTQLPDGSVLFGGPRPDKDTYTLTFGIELATVTAIRLEVLTDPALPQTGPGRQDNGNFHLSEFKATVKPADGGQATPIAISAAYADFDQSGWGVAAALDGKTGTAWGIHPEVSKPHAAIFVLDQPISLLGNQRLTVTLDQQHGTGHLIGRPRISLTSVPNPALARPIPAVISAILDIELSTRTPQQRAELARALMTWQIDAELAALPPSQLVYAAASEFKGGNNFRPAGMPRPVHVLRRGDINQPLDEVAPGALTCVPGVEAKFALPQPADEGSRRAALAHWLVDPQNVLTWRSIVNRIWHYHFDRGIVDTPNDLGRMGGTPSHPELLDWLAVEFRDSGGSLKNLHRLIVTSATYRQSSEIDAERSSIDGENRLLWRMNRRRLDAETIRDSLLQASGKLDLTMGGPSVKQFIESPGIHVTPIIDYQTYDVDSPGNTRRSVYRFLFRTLPDPLMESLDCPDGSQLAPSRSASVTALQALSLLDNHFVVRQSEHMAARLAQQAPAPNEQIRQLFQTVVLRDPAADESQRWEAYAARHGLANACRMMFNTNEFVFVH